LWQKLCTEDRLKNPSRAMPSEQNNPKKTHSFFTYSFGLIVEAPLPLKVVRVRVQVPESTKSRNWNRTSLWMQLIKKEAVEIT